MSVNLVSIDQLSSDDQRGDDFRANERTAPRRSTLIVLRVLDGPELDPSAIASDLSAGGAFVRTSTELETGTRLRLELELPTDTRPIEVSARVVRVTPSGLGVRFEELSARDRARLRAHAGYNEMDEAIVRLQQQLGDLIPGNLLPLGEISEIENILSAADLRMLDAVVLAPGRGFQPQNCRIADVSFENHSPDDPQSATLTLAGTEVRPAIDSRVVYVTFADGPLHYAFEAVVLRFGKDPQLPVPRRLYVTERRTNNRSEAREVWCELRAPHTPQGAIRLPVLDVGDGGASIQLEAGTPLIPGTHLPAFRVYGGGELREVPGATVRYINDMGDDLWRAGLHFDDAAAGRTPFDTLRQHSVRSSTSSRLRQGMALLRAKLAKALGRSDARRRNGVEVVRYRNRLGNTVAAIIDANFDTSNPDLQPDAVVVIAPALLKRKEVFGLLARTIVDDLGRDGHKVATLRFDFCNIVGESTMDPELEAQERPYLHWTMKELVADMEASLRYVEKRFRPAQRALVTFSFAAIGARRVILEQKRAPVDLWVAPFGCPDHQDMMRNYLAGLDLYPEYERGAGPELVYIHGRPVRGRPFYLETAKLGLAYLEQAREDISRIEAPITWILGTYDHWVTRSRVRSLLEAPGGGIREVFECATGHVLKEGSEAIEVFKLVSESISKHLFGNDRSAADPDLARFAAQSEAEWARVKRLKLTNAESFWKEHLFGSGGDELGYDIVLQHPAYRQFLKRQAELLDPRPGHSVADFGCGTGNLLMAMLEALPVGERPGRITALDLVPEALTRTEEKVLDHFSSTGTEPPPLRAAILDLEISRLSAIQDFLSGRVWSLEGLVGRVEGLEALTAKRIAASYGKELHEILRGMPTTEERVRQLCPDLGHDEVEVVLEIGRAARFLQGETLSEDLRTGLQSPRDTEDLVLDHLYFGKSDRHLELPFSEDTFDRIGCSLVVSYLSDPIVALREMHRMLRPGGVLVVSSILPNFDPSKLYIEEAQIIAQREGDEERRERELTALRSFANMMARLVELEEDGRFRFFSGDELKALVREAGFSDIHVFEDLGSPASAVIVRAEKIH